MRKIRHFFAGVRGSPERNSANSGYTYSEAAGYSNTDPGVPPVRIFEGYQPHPFAVTLPGAVSYPVDDSPVTVARYNMARGMHDTQLSNGWQRTNYGHRTTYASSGYLAEVVPQVPGQSRLFGQGGTPTAFTPKGGIAPSGWQNLVDQAQQQSVSTTGGPGQLGGTLQIGSWNNGG
jgi:hypothetical protein